MMNTRYAYHTVYSIRCGGKLNTSKSREENINKMARTRAFNIFNVKNTSSLFFHILLFCASDLDLSVILDL